MLNYDKDRNKYPVVYDNKYGITNLDELLKLEAAKTTFRSMELRSEGLKGNFDLQHLCAIHKHLFQDVYPWAGEIRDVDIAKGNTLFCLARNISDYSQDVFKTVKKFDRSAKRTSDEVSKHLATLSDDMNALHPFREGNGRSKRAFLSLYSRELGYELDLSKLNSEELKQAEIRAFTDGDVDGLAKIYGSVLEPIKVSDALQEMRAAAQKNRMMERNANVRARQSGDILE